MLWSVSAGLSPGRPCPRLGHTPPLGSKGSDRGPDPACCVCCVTRCLPARWGRPLQAGTTGPSPSPWCPQESFPARGRPREGQGATLGHTVSLSRAGRPKKTPRPSRSHLLLGPKEAQGWGSVCNGHCSKGPGVYVLCCFQGPGAKDTLSLSCPYPPREGCSQDKNTLGNIPWCLA